MNHKEFDITKHNRKITFTPNKRINIRNLQFAILSIPITLTSTDKEGNVNTIEKTFSYKLSEFKEIKKHLDFIQ